MKKLLLAGVTAMIALPILLLILTMAMLTGTATTADACGPAGPAQQVKGVSLNPEQLANAKTIVLTTHAPQTGKTVEIKPVSAWRGQIVAIRRPATRP